MSAIECIDSIVERICREPLDNEAAQLRFLQFWWSKTYSRPLKDPLLSLYTLEELYYEFKQSSEREKASKEKVEQEADNIEKEKMDDALAWAEAEEKKELEAGLKSNDSKPDWQPSEEDRKWMQDQMQKAKEVYGEDFGEDIIEDFE